MEMEVEVRSNRERCYYHVDSYIFKRIGSHVWVTVRYWIPLSRIVAFLGIHTYPGDPDDPGDPEAISSLLYLWMWVV